ncbi:MAG: GH3 auxin-responsive promoter family protein [Chitinophagales bacterium]
MASLVYFCATMFSHFLKFIFKIRYSFINRSRFSALRAQEQILKTLVESGRKTSFGREYGFEKIDNFNSFQNKVPIHSYEKLEAYIERILLGEQDVLWPDKISMFAKSSGTSNSKSKFIPLSSKSLKCNHYKAGRDLLAIFTNSFPEKNIFLSNNISVSGSFERSASGLKIGDLSALLLDNLPRWVQGRRVPSKKLALQTNWELKIDAIAKELLKDNPSSIAGVPSWNLVLLQKVLSSSKSKTLKELWPNFQVYFHGGVNFTPYKSYFEKLISSKDFVFMETYNASEGFFAIQDRFDGKENGMLLLSNHGVYYEFIELDELLSGKSETCNLQEVELNRNYALIISTYSGLYRYLIGDTIRFVDLDPFRIVLTGRVKYFINLFGEELIEENANRALELTCEDLNCSYLEYTIAPVYPDESGKGGHEWLIEFDISPENLNDFQQNLDANLKKLNSDYEAKRTADLALQMPIVKSLKKGSFYLWLKRNGKLGNQHKVPRLQSHREIADSILELQ